MRTSDRLSRTTPAPDARGSLAAVGAVLAIVAGVALSRVAMGHIVEGGLQKPLVELRVSIDDVRVLHEAHVPMRIFIERVLGLASLEELRALDDSRRAELVTAFFHETCPVTIDGVAVRPVLESVEQQVPSPAPPASGDPTAKKAGQSPTDGAESSRGESPPRESSEDATGDPIEISGSPAPPTDPDTLALEYGAVVLRLRHDTKGAPQRVSLVWRLYDPDGPSFLSYGKEAVVAEIDAGGTRRLEVFTSEEPEVIWRSPDASVPPAPAGLVAGEPAPPGEAMRVPALAVTLILAALVLVIVLRRRPLAQRVLWPAMLAVIGAVAGVFDIGDVAIGTRPSGRTPDAVEAVAIFRSLHRNIYRAFDYTSEREIYDTLAASVAGEQLESIYADVYESLISREDGGAVCRVRSVEVLDARIVESAADVEPEPGGFAVRCRWVVHGLIRHWGHTHERSRKLAAVYAVAPRGGSWKIVDTGPVEQEAAASAGAGVR